MKLVRSRAGRRRIMTIGGLPMSDGDRPAVPETAGRMTRATSAFLAALTEAQRARACFGFGDERRDWSFLPEPERAGLPIGALDDGQRRLAHELIEVGTSLPGYTKGLRDGHGARAASADAGTG